MPKLKSVGRVERVENLIAGDRNGVSRRNTAFHLDDRSLPVASHEALDIVAELLEFAAAFRRRMDKPGESRTSPMPTMAACRANAI